MLGFHYISLFKGKQSQILYNDHLFPFNFIYFVAALRISTFVTHERSDLPLTSQQLGRLISQQVFFIILVIVIWEKDETPNPSDV